MHIRRAAPGHLSLLLPMISAFYAADGHDFDAVRVSNALRPLLQDDRHGVVYLIEDGGAVVGYSVVTWGWALESGGRDALLDEIYVEPHGRGLGGRALEEIIDDLKSRNIPLVWLETERSNERARTFYSRHGFAADDSVWMSRSL
jgi:ribosomal protein S18 acetylase RimI-like enzyme